MMHTPINEATVESAFIQVLRELSLLNEDQPPPGSVHVHVMPNSYAVVQYYDREGIQRAEGTYTSGDQRSELLLEWANTPIGTKNYGLRFGFAVDSRGQPLLHHEPVAA